jgi:hypothetical protein
MSKPQTKPLTQVAALSTLPISHSAPASMRTRAVFTRPNGPTSSSRYGSFPVAPSQTMSLRATLSQMRNGEPPEQCFRATSTWTRDSEINSWCSTQHSVSCWLSIRKIPTNILKAAIGQAVPGVLRLHAPLSLPPAMSTSPTTRKPSRKLTGPSTLCKSSKIAVFRTPTCTLVTRLLPKRLLQVKVLLAQLLFRVLPTPLANAMKLQLEPTRLS